MTSPLPPGLAQWVKRSGTAAAAEEVAGVAPIQPLVQECPYVAGAAIKKENYSCAKRIQYVLTFPD